MKPIDSANAPLAIVAEYTNRKPDIWDWCEDLRSVDVAWDRDRCYLPISAAVSMMMQFKLPTEAMFMIPALAAWRLWKEVYTFDADLAAELYAQADDTRIPSEIVMQLPFPCVYIDSGKYRFFAYLENDVNDLRWELRFARIMDDGSRKAYFLHLGDFTLFEAIADGINEAGRVLERAKTEEIIRDTMVYNAKDTGAKSAYADALNPTVIGEMLQLVLYICADNADVRQNDANRSTFRERKPNAKPVDRFREIRKWDVGSYIGGALRNQKNTPSPTVNDPAGTGSKKRPHIRRGHWHHFWKGSQDDRKLILHWVLPLMVHRDQAVDSPARVDEVKPNEEKKGESGNG